MEETTAILNQTKTPFWSRRRDRDEADDAVLETTPEVSSKLGSLIQQLDAGIAQSNERERATQQGRKRDLHPVADPAPVVPSSSIQAEAPAPTPKIETVELDDPVTNEALRIIADQRRAAEALLSETRALEDQIKNAAVAAQATRAYQSAKTTADEAVAKVNTVVAAEAEARQRADALIHDHSIIASELKSIETLVSAKRTQADAAKAEIAELERRIGELQRNSQTVFSDLALHESRARECGTRETAAARTVAEAAARAAARKAEREAAELAAQTALGRAEALKAELPPVRESGAIEDLARLTARITEQAALARNLRIAS